jgi:4-amino-4-deoxy-L-arabinose transferase-like glycosyltransferase
MASTDRTAALKSPATRVRDSRLLVALVLVAPFLVMIAALRGMTVALPIFHGSDELVYHYPTILGFSNGLPFPDLHSYRTAQTPLFHLLMAYAGQVVGYALWRLRLLQVLISYLLALATYALLRRRLRMERTQALAMTLLFVLSPYVFGQSFRLVTDNLALLFTVLAVERFERSRASGRTGPFLVGCACVAAAILTRQSTAFLLAVAALYALRPEVRRSPREATIRLAAVALSAVPAGLLFLNWHGLVPVGSIPTSCGLCSSSRSTTGLSTQGLDLQTMELALATIGLYGVVLFAPLLLSRVRADLRGPHPRERLRRAAVVPALGALAGAVLLLIFPATPANMAAGDIWRLAGHAPSIHGTSLLFWVLVPLAGAVLVVRLGKPPSHWLASVFAACFLLSTVVIRSPQQKYVDPFALLVLIFTLAPRELDSWWRLAGAAVLTIAFIGYTADYSSHRSTPHAAIVVAAPSAPHTNTVSAVQSTQSARRAATTDRAFRPAPVGSLAPWRL